MSLIPRATHPTDVHRFEHEAMSCVFGIELAGTTARYAAQAARAAFDELDRLQQTLSRFDPHSDIAQIRALRPGESVRVAIETIECLRLAALLYDLTNGAFDIAYLTPGRGALAPLVLDPAAHAVGVRMADVQLDLGGIGKGYAVDRVVDMLRDWGIPAGCVHSGQSTVRVFGRPADEDGWRVGLRDPRQPNRSIDIVTLRDASLSGSGRHLHAGHIFDPRRGQPATGVEASWAIAPRAALADGLSTAFMVLSQEEVAAVCEHVSDVSGVVYLGGPEQALLRFGRLNDFGDRPTW